MWDSVVVSLLLPVLPWQPRPAAAVVAAALDAASRVVAFQIVVVAVRPIP